MSNNSQFHFFGSNAFEWKTSPDLLEVIGWFATQKVAYQLWYVPQDDEGADYPINNYVPQVEGTKYLGTFRGKKTLT